MNKHAHSVAAFASLRFWGCFDSGTENKAVNFDRAAMLANYADRLILPGYIRLEAMTNSLNNAVGKLVEAPDSARMKAARTSLRDAWLAWQGCSAYEVGPASQVLLRQRVNTFPTKVAQI